MSQHDGPSENEARDGPQGDAGALDKGGSTAADSSRRGVTVSDADEFAGLLPAQGRLIGIDGGTKRIGLALSDVTRMIASPLGTIERRKFSIDANDLLALAGRHGVCGLVLGYPANLDASHGPRSQATRAFARNLNAISPLPILLWDERLTTVEAERLLISADTSRKRRGELIDRVAATLILQGTLDYLRSAAQK